MQNTQAKVIVEDTSKLVENTTKITSELTNKLVEEGVGVTLPDLFKLDVLQEEQAKEEEEDDDDEDSEDEVEDVDHATRLKTRKKVDVDDSGQKKLFFAQEVETAPAAQESRYRSSSGAQESRYRTTSGQSTEAEPSTLADAPFQTPHIKGLGVVKKLSAEPW